MSTRPSIAVIDYKKGNLRSVERGLIRAGADAFITDAPRDILRADAVVLPGVGAFTDAMDTMDELGQTEAVRAAIAQGSAFLGICLGMHLMFEGGTEHAHDGGITDGIGIIDGIVDDMPRTSSTGDVYKIPHVGWNTVEVAHPDVLFDGIEDGSYFYFTHSFKAPDSAFTIGTTTHSVTFPSVVRKDRAFGVQFHPEKSSDVGALLLENFVRLVSED